jgi:hypothetical protein
LRKESVEFEPEVRFKSETEFNIVEFEATGELGCKGGCKALCRL